MDAARPGSGQTNAQLAGVLCVGAGHERSGLFVAHLDEPDLLLALAQRFDDAVDAVARKTEDDLYAPVVERIEKNIGCSIRHD